MKDDEAISGGVRAECNMVVHNHPSGDPTPSPEDVIRADTSVCPYATSSSASSATSASRKEGLASFRIPFVVSLSNHERPLR